MIEVIVQDEDGSRNIIFSGDIGQWDKPLLNNPTVFDRADYVVMESTYGAIMTAPKMWKRTYVGSSTTR